METRHCRFCEASERSTPILTAIDGSHICFRCAGRFAELLDSPGEVEYQSWLVALREQQQGA